MPNQSHLTDAHYLGIGRIASAWASLESLLMFAVGALLEIEMDRTTIMFWHMGYNDRRDRLVSLAQYRLDLDDESRKEFDCLITRMNAAYRIRNTIVHSVWNKSDQPDAITPFIMIARGKLKVSGLTMPKEHFTASRLYEEAEKIQRLGQDFHQFATAYFGYPPAMPDEPMP